MRDNLHQFTPEVLGEISQVVVRVGQSLKKDTLTARCNSFVTETDVYYPTDISLLYDAMRKVIKLTADHAQKHSTLGKR